MTRFVTFTVLTALAASACAPFLSPPQHQTPLVDSVLTCREGTAGVDLRWIETADESGRVANGTWCLTVGPWIVADYRGATDVPPMDSLAIVTWNTYLGGGDLVRFVDDLRAGVHTDGEPPEHFVILLQEVYRGDPDLPKTIPEGVTVPPRVDPAPPSGRRIDIVESARRLGLWMVYVPSMRNGRPEDWPEQEDRGNAILSTLELVDLTAIALPFEKYRRVVVAGTVVGESEGGASWRIRICNAHLDNRARFPRFLQSAGAGRLRQAKALLPVLTETPCVLGGDFNTWAPEALETAIPFIRDAFDQPERLDKQTTVAAKFVPDRRVDYIFFRLPAGHRGRYMRLDERYGSDHYPLLGWVDLVARP